jgi:hypothetical protein
MTGLDDTNVRDELTRALEVFDPAPPPFAAILARATGRRRRRRRVTTVFSMVALPAAVAAVVIAGVSINPGSTAQVRTASPTRHSLVTFAKAHGGKVIGGPFAGTATSYGAFATKKGIVVADYTGSHWQLDGPPITSITPAGAVQKIARGPVLATSAPTPAIWAKIEGGDVSYFGVVLHHVGDRWRLAKFGTCGHHNLCYGVTNEQAYGHPVGGRGFVSVQNNCKPYCAAGTNYRIHWQWKASRGRFETTSVHNIKR